MVDMTSMSAACEFRSLDQIADEHGLDLRRLRYIIARDRITPVGRIGGHRTRVFGPDQVAEIVAAFRRELPRGRRTDERRRRS